MAKRKLFDIWAVAYIVIFIAYAIFLIYPMFTLLLNSFLGEKGNLSIEWFSKFFSNKYYSDTLIRSFNVSIVTTALSLIVGIPLAYF